MTTEPERPPTSPPWRSLLSRAVRIAWVLVGLYGACCLAGNLLLAIGMVQPSEVRAEYFSPSREHCILLTSDETGVAHVRAVEILIPGIHIFKAMPLYIQRGVAYAADWPSNRLAVLYVTNDFAFSGEGFASHQSGDGSIDMDDGAGQFRITLRRLKRTGPQ